MKFLLVVLNMFLELVLLAIVCFSLGDINCVDLVLGYGLLLCEIALEGNLLRVVLLGCFDWLLGGNWMEAFSVGMGLAVSGFRSVGMGFAVSGKRAILGGFSEVILLLCLMLLILLHEVLFE